VDDKNPTEKKKSQPNNDKRKGVCKEYGHNEGINIPIITTMNSN